MYKCIYINDMKCRLPRKSIPFPLDANIEGLTCLISFLDAMNADEKIFSFETQKKDKK